MWQNQGIVFEKKLKKIGTNSHTVLLLNQGYEPLSLCSAKRAITLIVLEKAEIISQFENYTVSSISVILPWPSVIRLKQYIRVPYQNVILSRKNIIRRDNRTCAYCGKKDHPLTIDHILPRSRGGEDSWENLITSCTVCNHKKGNRTPQEADMPLLFQPYKPGHSFLFRSTSGEIDESWRPFLFI